MRRNRANNLVRSQRSVFYYADLVGQDDPQLKKRRDYFEHSEPHMLIDDVGHSVMPIGGEWGSSFEVKLVPAENDVERIVVAALDTKGYEDRLAPTLCDFVADCSRTVMAFGEAFYEIVYLSEAPGRRAIGFDLSFIQPGTLTEIVEEYIQYLPEDVAKREGTKRYVALPKDSVAAFRAPLETDEFFRMMDSLAFSSTNYIPEFALKQLGGDKSTVPYDTTAHIASRKLALAAATKPVGWNARGLFEDEILEYYSFWRRLKFERFKVELRERVLATLNEVLDRAGKRIGFSAKFEIQGLPSINDIEAARRKLESGTSNFAEILSAFRRPQDE